MLMVALQMEMVTAGVTRTVSLVEFKLKISKRLKLTLLSVAFVLGEK